MATDEIVQQLLASKAPGLATWGLAFLNAKKAEGLARSTLKGAYAPVLLAFFAFCTRRGVGEVEAIDPELIRGHLLAVGEGHAPSTIHRHYRVIKTWLRWYEVEAAPDGWRNPIRRLRAPKVPEQILDPVSLEDLAELVRVANTRDRAILLAMVDTGLRAGELLALDVEDFDNAEGVFVVRHGKGGRARVAPLGQTARRAVRRWIRERQPAGRALFTTTRGNRMNYWALRTMLGRLADRADVPRPKLHGIRRAFGIGMLRAGVDLLTVSRMLGHSTVSQTPKYLKQVVADLRAAVERASLADRL